MKTSWKNGYRVLRPQDVPQPFNGAFALDVLEGLCKRPKQIPSQYFYDARGSDLFRRISKLEEYYLPGCELEILKNGMASLAEALPRDHFNLVELGAGDGAKTIIILEYLLENGFDFEYFPVDICEESVVDLTQWLSAKFAPGELRVNGLVAEYFDALRWLASMDGLKTVAIFLGSSIGNFDEPGARRFLRHLWNSLEDRDQVLIGFDLKKNIEILNRAYNDAENLTKEFNLNLLDRMNRELGAEFDRDNFTFYSQYDVISGAVESWLVSRKAHEVFIRDLERSFSFELCEAIHTESSHKYSNSDIELLARDTGFVIEKQLFDSRRFFTDSLWRVNKS